MVAGTGFCNSLEVLSQFPIVGHYSKTNVAYLLDRKRFQVSRGFVEIEIQVKPGYKFTLFNAHLKSMRQVTLADQTEMRLEKARALRRLVEKHLKVNPVENILLMGDLNEFPSKDPVRVLIRKRSPRLVDLRPVEKTMTRCHPLLTPTIYLGVSLGRISVEKRIGSVVWITFWQVRG